MTKDMIKKTSKKMNKKMAKRREALDKISAINSVSSPFFSLPRELRDLIYEHIIMSGSKVVGRGTITEYLQQFSPEFVQRYAGALLACRQIYKEFHLLPFKHVTLAAKGDFLWSRMMRMNNLQMNAIQKLQLKLEIKDNEGESLLPGQVPIKNVGLIEILDGLKGLKKVVIWLRYAHLHDWRTNRPWLRINPKHSVKEIKEHMKCYVEGWHREKLEYEVVLDRS